MCARRIGSSQGGGFAGRTVAVAVAASNLLAGLIQFGVWWKLAQLVPVQAFGEGNPAFCGVIFRRMRIFWIIFWITLVFVKKFAYNFLLRAVSSAG